MKPTDVLLQPDECAFLFVDYQEGLASGVESIARQVILNNAVSLARTAVVFGVPVIASTSASRVYSGRLLPSLQAVMPDVKPIERHNMNAWEDDAVRAAIVSREWRGVADGFAKSRANVRGSGSDRGRAAILSPCASRWRSGGDIFDRRQVILLAETAMATIAVILACLSLAGKMSPILLLILTFALSAGDAFETPTWRAVLPELVQKEDLSSASALNGIEFNQDRAVGPALGGMLIAFAGVGFAFLINAVSFMGVIVVIARWQRPAVERTSPPETVAGATITALQYLRYSPVIRSVMLRVGVAMFFSSGFLALLPSIAHRANT